MSWFTQLVPFLKHQPLAQAAGIGPLWHGIHLSLTTLYWIMLILVSSFGFHRWLMIMLYYRYRHRFHRCQANFLNLPRITVQLPMFNERYVAERIIAAACALDYPRDKLQIQVLDDSTDDTTDIARAAVARFADQGFDIQYRHRDERTGYKAGALQAALPYATGDFVLIFDADFVPSPDILQKTIHYFTDETVGMVQVRWDHINRQQSLLTQGQAILLDAHFVIEHTARNRSGRFMNFNGTAGIWRKSCIMEGGGWQHDTLSEDLDLSYRCQIKGWRFLFLPEVTSPAELPPDIDGFKLQQFRWTKGTIQAAKKLLPRVFRSRLPLKIKIEAFFHLLNPMCYLFMSIMVLLLLPVFYLRFQVFDSPSIGKMFFDVTIFVVAGCSAGIFYLASQRELFPRWLDKIKYLPFLMALAVGIAISNSWAVLQALFGRDTTFERTPKFGVNASDHSSQWISRARSFARKQTILPFIELAYGCYITFCLILCIHRYSLLTSSVPFLLIFAFGYFYVGFLSLHTLYLSNNRRLPVSSSLSAP